jgi:hypothetical protein
LVLLLLQKAITIMETVIERDVTAYEIERGKSTPSSNHSKLEKRLVVALSRQYEDQYVHFGAGVKSCWIVIPTFQTILVFSSKREYRTFTKEKLTDNQLGIELDLIDSFR